MEISKLRKEIDQIDVQIVKNLNKRAKLAVEIGRLKRKTGQSIYVPDREKKIYQHIESLNKGPLSSRSLKAIYSEIMSGTLSIEKLVKIAYLGPKATFTHLASLKKFGTQVKYMECANITDIFLEVEKERCDYGVVPIENSIEGAVTHTLDMLVDTDLKICAEVTLEITHSLLAKCRQQEIKRVYSHPQVFGQCRFWLESNLANVELRPVSSTAKAAELVSKERFTAAIASEMTARLYKLNVLVYGIEDTTHNITRFLVVGKTYAGLTGEDKTSIIFSIKDRVGALHNMLIPFKKNKINLTKIESRPSRKKAWEYYFFVDLEGHCEEQRVKTALKELEGKCVFLKVLGSYPKE